MIEKLQARKRDDGFLEPATLSDMHWKINELVDAVNEIMTWRFETDDEPVENIYTKTCRMEKEFAEEELERTKKKLDIAVEALKCICEQGMSLKQFEIPRHIVMLEEASEALEQINNKED